MFAVSTIPSVIPTDAVHIPPPAIEIERKEAPVDSRILCNCYLYTKQLIPSLPSTSTILDNLQLHVGDVAVFYYPESGLHHYAAVTWTDGWRFSIDEANYRTCQQTNRTLTLEYPRLIGFYSQ